MLYKFTSSGVQASVKVDIESKHVYLSNESLEGYRQPTIYLSEFNELTGNGVPWTSIISPLLNNNWTIIIDGAIYIEDQYDFNCLDWFKSFGCKVEAPPSGRIRH